MISDLEKVLDTLERNRNFLKRRDEMNAELHLAREVRYSPLTTETMGQCDRVRTMLENLYSREQGIKLWQQDYKTMGELFYYKIFNGDFLLRNQGWVVFVCLRV